MKTRTLHTPSTPKTATDSTTATPPENAAKPKSKKIGPQLREDEFKPLPKLSAAQIAKLGVDNARAPAREPRLRFAPSPTGYLHIGGARTALFNYLVAKKLGGKFLLRIEDTDPKRSEQKYTDPILEGLQWLGIRWDGEVVYQSKRAELYNEKIDLLIGKNKAYVDDEGAVRFRMPEAGSVIVVNDHVRGKVPVVVSEETGMHDYVIRRKPKEDGSLGAPMFLLANCIDDGEMGITHVIRGDDHLLNAAKQIPLIQALGYPIPEWFHVALICDDDGQKLSKRKGAQSVLDFRNSGYTPVALVNHLARLGVGFETHETLPMDELAKAIDFYRFSNSPARIGFRALEERSKGELAGWSAEAIATEVGQRKPALDQRLGPDRMRALAEASRARAATLEEVGQLAEFILAEPLYAPNDREHHLDARNKARLKQLTAQLEQLAPGEWSQTSLGGIFGAFNQEQHLDLDEYQELLRWALTGVVTGLPLDTTLLLLGPDESLRRLKALEQN